MSSETFGAFAPAPAPAVAPPDPDPAAEPEPAATLPQAVAVIAHMAAISRYRAPVRALSVSGFMSHWTRTPADRFRCRGRRVRPIPRPAPPPLTEPGDLGLYQAVPASR